MKINSLSLLLLFGSALPALVSAPLTESATVHLRADTSSPTLATLKAGTEPKATALATASSVPVGWIAVELPGPHDVYVQNKEITKSLDVRPGADLRTGPKLDAPVIATALAGERLDITELVGRWTKLRLTRPVVGYVRASAQPFSPLPAASVPSSSRAAPAPGAPAAAPVSTSPVRPAAYGSNSAGVQIQQAPVQSFDAWAGALGADQGSSALPRSFQGRFVSTRSPFKPRRPYDWALTDETGSRFAYLDIAKLLQTEQIEKYVDRVVAVFGTAKPVPGSKDFVIAVESFQLK